MGRILRDWRLQAVIVLPLCAIGAYLGAIYTPYSGLQVLTALGIVATLVVSVIQVNERWGTSEDPPPVEEVLDRIQDDTPTLGESVLQYLDVITDEYGRTAFDHLQDVEETTVSNLAREVAARRDNVSIDAVSTDQYREAHEELYTEHLSSMEDIGLVTFDREQGMVQLTPPGRELGAYVEERELGGDDEQNRSLDPEDITADGLFEVISNDRRRRVLGFLASRGSSTRLDVLADHLAAWEDGETTATVSENRRKRAYVSLYQVHLPKLDERGYISYDDEAGDISIESPGRYAHQFVERLKTTHGLWDEERLGTYMDLLSSWRRRLVFSYLGDNQRATLGEIAEHVAARENGVAVGELSSNQRKRVYVALYQAHLPKMADAGVIDFEPDTGVVQLLDEGELLTELMADLPVEITGERPGRAE